MRPSATVADPGLTRLRGFNDAQANVIESVRLALHRASFFSVLTGRLPAFGYARPRASVDLEVYERDFLFGYLRDFFVGRVEVTHEGQVRFERTTVTGVPQVELAVVQHRPANYRRMVTVVRAALVARPSSSRIRRS